MTVCIAAICGNGQEIVVATDRMYTFPGIGLQMQLDCSKIEKLASNCVALGAGGSAQVLDVWKRLEAVKTGIAPSIPILAEAVRSAYVEVREAYVDSAFVQPACGGSVSLSGRNGVSLPTYLRDQPKVAETIIAGVGQYNLGVDILVAGIDGAGAYLGVVSHPGILIRCDSLGFAAIGTGAPLAMATLIQRRQAVSLSSDTTQVNAYYAKRLAEFAPGVGRKTEMGRLLAAVYFPTDSDELEKAYTGPKPETYSDSETP